MGESVFTRASSIQSNLGISSTSGLYIPEHRCLITIDSLLPADRLTDGRKQQSSCSKKFCLDAPADGTKFSAKFILQMRLRRQGTHTNTENQAENQWENCKVLPFAGRECDWHREEALQVSECSGAHPKTNKKS